MKLFPTDYPEYQTSFYVVCKKHHSEKSIIDIFNSSEFSQKINGYINTRFDNIVFLTIFPIKNKENLFEKIKKDFIKSLKNVCSYVSVIYDNQTINYMQEISKSVYVLEREFRSLIELIFLKEIGVDWYNVFFKDKDKEKSRNEGRDEVLGLLNNPLDNLDFLHLKNFVEDRIKVSKNYMSDKIDAIENTLSTFEQSPETSEAYKKIIQLLEDVRKLSNFKKTSMDVSKLYKHITSELADEWSSLYFLHRNPWAHNHFLMTRGELEKYKELASSVLTKLRTETTLLSLLENSREYKIESNRITILLTNFSKLGTPFCRLKLQIKSGNQQHILEKQEATYVDFFSILATLAKFSGFMDEKLDIKFLKLSPYLIDSITEYGKKLLDSETLNEKIDSNLDELESFLLEEDSDYQLKKLEGTKVYMKEDVDTLLNELFN